MRDHFAYMGKQVDIEMNESGDAAKIKIEGREFHTHLHTAGEPEDNYIKLWMCADAYGMQESPEKMAKQIIKYWHQFV